MFTSSAFIFSQIQRFVSDSFLLRAHLYNCLKYFICRCSQVQDVEWKLGIYVCRLLFLLTLACFDVCRRGSLLLWTHCLLLISDVLWTQNGEIFPKMGILLPITRKHPRSRNAMISKGLSSWLNVEISIWALPTPPPCTVDIHAQGTCLLQPRTALTCSLPLRLQPPATLALGHCVVFVQGWGGGP